MILLLILFKLPNFFWKRKHRNKIPIGIITFNPGLGCFNKDKGYLRTPEKYKEKKRQEHFCFKMFSTFFVANQLFVFSVFVEALNPSLYFPQTLTCIKADAYVSAQVKKTLFWGGPLFKFNIQTFCSAFFDCLFTAT
jgi:hypothetical protein